MSSALWDAVRMERRRVSTVRAPYVLAGAAVLLGGFIALMIALLAPQGGALTPARTSAALTAGGDSLPMSVVGALMAVLGVVSVAQDYRFGLVQAVLTAQPRRGVVVVARLAVLAAIAAGVSVAVSGLGAAICSLAGRAPAHDLGTFRVASAHLLLSVLWAWLGAGLVWVLRSSAGAVSILLLGPLLVEPLIGLAAENGGPAAQEVVRWLPFTAAREALGRRLLPTPEAIGALAGGLVFAAATVVVVGAAWLVVQRRDA